MFQLSVISDEISQDLDVAIELAKKHRLDALEIRSVADKGPFEFTLGDVERIKDKLSAAGLQVSAISAPFFKCGLDDEEEVRRHIEGLERCIGFARVLDTKLIRGFTFWHKDTLAQRLPDIVRRFEAPDRLLREAGMVLALESDPSVYAANAGELRQVLEAVNSPRIQALWDPGNNLYSPRPEVPYPHGYKLIRPYLAHVHLKDAVQNEQGEAVGCCFGEGLVDYPGQLQALIDDGYEGYVVMETHYRKASVLSKEALERPGGSDFSAEGYEPTEECLISLLRMISTLHMR